MANSEVKPEQLPEDPQKPVAELRGLYTRFGAKLQGNKFDQMDAATKAGLRMIRPPAVEMKSYGGDAQALEDWYDAGFGPIQNVTWSSANPAPFPKGADLDTYKVQFSKFLRDHGTKPKVVIIENEPTNRSFYDYTNSDINDYLAQLAASVEIAHKFGVKVADGCTHIEILRSVMKGQTNRDNQKDVAAIVKALKTIPVDFVNVHTKFQNDSIVIDDLKTVTTWLAQQTGKRVMSNEWHLENCTPRFIQTVVNEWKKCQLAYCLVWDQAALKDEGGSITNANGVLTEMGTIYALSIKLVALDNVNTLLGKLAGEEL